MVNVLGTNVKHLFMGVIFSGCGRCMGIVYPNSLHRNSTLREEAECTSPRLSLVRIWTTCSLWVFGHGKIEQTRGPSGRNLPWSLDLE